MRPPEPVLQILRQAADSVLEGFRGIQGCLEERLVVVANQLFQTKRSDEGRQRSIGQRKLDIVASPAACPLDGPHVREAMRHPSLRVQVHEVHPRDRRGRASRVQLLAGHREIDIARLIVIGKGHRLALGAVVDRDLPFRQVVTDDAPHTRQLGVDRQFENIAPEALVVQLTHQRDQAPVALIGPRRDDRDRQLVIAVIVAIVVGVGGDGDQPLARREGDRLTTVLVGSGSWLNGSTFLGLEAPVHITVTDAFDLGQFAAEEFLKRTESEGGNRHGHRFVATAANDRSVRCFHHLARQKVAQFFLHPLGAGNVVVAPSLGINQAKVL